MTTTETFAPRYTAAVQRHDAGLHRGRTVQQQTAGDCPKCMTDERNAYEARVDQVHGR